MEDVLRRFKEATDVLDQAGLDYLVFGGIAVWAYGRRRGTRDIDLLVRADQARDVLAALAAAGFQTEETDSRWLFKAFKAGVAIDIIFESKGAIRLTDELLSRQRRVAINHLSFKVIDPENLLLIKILAKKEIRPADWYDALSILEARHETFDWDYFIAKSRPYTAKVLSFLFFAQAEHLEHVGKTLIPQAVIDQLIGVYREKGSS